MVKFKLYTFLILLSVLFLSCSSNRALVEKQDIPLDLLTGTHIQDYNPSIEKSLSEKRRIIVNQAIKCLGLPYKWGGHSPKKGFDCSGLVVFTHRKADISIARTAKAQFTNADSVSKENLLPADLIFFNNPRESKTLHVGIYIGDGLFVHAPGKGRQVTYARLDNPYFSKHFIGSKTYL